ncbi:hypothetical protein KIK84_01325 [Curvibacter sp. CHRR-16]|uniref:hypothetical protein n=1 Tax=Curvibacter sp. CHRR-16 TaxID=2835872 RepID=UPI001BD93949|nr:hypothetical protein [Curvibacter sp. CHRR-16]MBT0568955.1 hypothetical protein [Curvibacter sp. CHRR-16]
MGYFDGLTNASFKKDKNGTTVFFPWGIFGKGRVLADEVAEAKVRAFVHRFYKVSVPTSIGVGVLFGWAWAFLLVAIFYGWYYAGTKPLISGCSYSDDKLTLKEVYSNSAEGHSKVTLWLLFVGSVLLVLMGVFVATTGAMILGLLAAAVFGATATAFGYMLKLKHGA